jgi:hypothetical protein
MVARPENLEAVSTILAQILGRPVTVECQLGEQAKLSQKVMVTTTLPTNGGPDPLVQFAVTELSAEVLEEEAQ